MSKPTIVHSAESAARCTRIEACSTVTVTGRVISGRGEATSNMRENALEVGRALGEKLVEGSLNVILKRPLMLRSDFAIKTRFSRAAPPQLEWPGQLNGQEVWLHRWHNAPLHIVEALSAVHLRTHLNLADGDEVKITVRERDVGPISRVGRLTWILFWSGRTRWTYTHDRYVEPAQRWCTEYGATQLDTDKNCRDLAMALMNATAKHIPGARSLGSRFRKS
jgi:hypothetical protein